jgi:hypothetical protein
MTQEEVKYKELDSLMHNALVSNDELIIPPGLSDRTIQRLEKKVLFREILLELFLKLGLVTGSLIILVGVFIWINGSDVLFGLINRFMNNWQLISSLLILISITILIDQVGLKFHDALHKEVS